MISPTRRCYSASCRPGWLGLVVASLAAAYISTISTHLNWGSSYIVHDVYGRFHQAGSEREENRFLHRPYINRA